MKLLLVLLAAAAPLFAQCTYSVSPDSFSYGPGSTGGFGSGQSSVFAPPTCSWQSKSNVTWIAITSGKAGTGNGSVAWSVDRNVTNAARTGIITVGTATITVTQAAAVCNTAIIPTALNFPVTGGVGSVQVSSSCVWAVASNQSWIVVASGTQGTFDGKFNFTVTPNGCLDARSGQLGVGLTGQAQTLQVTEDGSPANLVLTPSTATIGPQGQDGSVSIGLGAGCHWTAFSDVSWLTLTSAASGNGPGSLSFRAAANTSSTRSGNLHIGPQLFTVTQQAIAAPSPQISALTNAASGAQGAVAPGEIVSIFGSALGPQTGATLQLSSDGKSITKSLGGVQVLFDDVPAAITYASALQINVVVPYAVAGKTSTAVQVIYEDVPSGVMTIAVQPSAPGIFTQDGTGIGAGAILNQDYSTNANANRAARGSVVQIYCTGGGATNPASLDAAITGTPLPLLKLPVQVTIGGLHADVSYSGGAPTAIAGLTQVNAVVPSGVIPGPTVPVVVQIGDSPSQAGVTLAVK